MTERSEIHAIEAGDDYIWVLNNDPGVTDGALAACLHLLAGDPRCGAVSPVAVRYARQ